MKALRLTEQAIQYKASRNRYGDVILARQGYIKCLFRNVSQLNHIQNSEEVQIAGHFWFDKATTLTKGDVVGIYNQLYRIEQVIVARDRLRLNTIQFIKATVSLYRAIS